MNLSHRLLAGLLLVPLVCAVLPTPAFGLRAVGLEESTERDKVAHLLNVPDSAHPEPVNGAATRSLVAQPQTAWAGRFSRYVLYGLRQSAAAAPVPTQASTPPPAQLTGLEEGLTPKQAHTKIIELVSKGQIKAVYAGGDSRLGGEGGFMEGGFMREIQGPGDPYLQKGLPRFLNGLAKFSPSRTISATVNGDIVVVTPIGGRYVVPLISAAAAAVAPTLTSMPFLTGLEEAGPGVFVEEHIRQREMALEVARAAVRELPNDFDVRQVFDEASVRDTIRRTHYVLIGPGLADAAAFQTLKESGLSFDAVAQTPAEARALLALRVPAERIIGLIDTGVTPAAYRAVHPRIRTLPRELVETVGLDQAFRQFYEVAAVSVVVVQDPFVIGGLQPLAMVSAFTTAVHATEDYFKTQG